MAENTQRIEISACQHAHRCFTTDTGDSVSSMDSVNLSFANKVLYHAGKIHLKKRK